MRKLPEPHQTMRRLTIMFLTIAVALLLGAYLLLPHP